MLIHFSVKGPRAYVDTMSIQINRNYVLVIQFAMDRSLQICLRHDTIHAMVGVYARHVENIAAITV